MLQNAHVFLAHFGGGIGIEEFGIVVAHDLFDRRGEALAQQAVGEQVAAICIFHVDVGGDVFQNIGKQFLALLECLVGTAASQRDLGQIGGLFDQADLFIRRVMRLM